MSTISTDKEWHELQRVVRHTQSVLQAYTIYLSMKPSEEPTKTMEQFIEGLNDN